MGAYSRIYGMYNLLICQIHKGNTQKGPFKKNARNLKLLEKINEQEHDL